MKLNTALSELVVLANTLDEQGISDVAADLDAAIFILSSEDAVPTNKSMASVVRENYASLDGVPTEELEQIAVAAASDIAVLQEEILQLDAQVMTAFLKTLAQSLRSVLNPSDSITDSALHSGADLLAEAEKKLAERDSLRNVGYRIGVLRSKLEENHG